MTRDRWRLLGAVVALAALVAFVVLDWARFVSDFWPPDRAFIAPNITATVVQVAVVSIALAIFYPPFRRLVGKAAHAVIGPVIHAHLEHHRELTRQVDAELHRKLDHLIRHSKDVPDLPPMPESKP